jgi:hypothetical protein
VGSAVLLLLASLCLAENLWATAPATGTRWPDVAVTTVTLAAGDEVEVLVKDGDTVRVRKGTDFGWVPASALTSAAPVKPEPSIDLSALGLPSLDGLPEAADE